MAKKAKKKVDLDEIEEVEKVVVRVKRPSMIADIAASVEDAIGEGTTYFGSDSERGEPAFFIPSGVESLDLVLDREGRGYPVGRIIEVFGAEQTCKTALGYAIIAEAQKMGGDAMLFPTTEGNFDEWLAEKYGIDLKRLVIVDDPTVEGVFEAFYRAMKVIGRDGLLVAVIDSIAALTTRDEYKSDSFDKDRGPQHRAWLMAKALRKIGAEIPGTNCLLFCINQVRDNADSAIGKAKAPGGRALKFQASIRLRLELPPSAKIWRTSKGKKYVGGFKIKATAEKNRMAAPYQSGMFKLDFENGLLPIDAAASKGKGDKGED